MLPPYFLNCFVHCLPPGPIILFLTNKSVIQFSYNPESSIKSKSQEKGQLRNPNSIPSVASCSYENIAHGECVMIHNGCNSTQYLPISSISCSVVASSTVSSPGPSSLLAQILNTYVVLGSSRYTSICL